MFYVRVKMERKIGGDGRHPDGRLEGHTGN